MYTREQVSWCSIDDNLPRHEEWPAGFGSATVEGREPPAKQPV